MSRLLLPQLRTLCQSVGWRVGVPQGLLVAMAVCESGNRNRPEDGCDTLACRVEEHLPLVDGQPDESRGLLQILCSTARGLGMADLNLLWRAEDNLRLGATYVRQLAGGFYPEVLRTTPGGLIADTLSRTDREKWLFGVAAYNAGPGRVRRAVRAAGPIATLSIVLNLLDGDSETSSRNELTTKHHVVSVRRVWAAEDVERDYEA